MAEVFFQNTYYKVAIIDSGAETLLPPHPLPHIDYRVILLNHRRPSVNTPSQREKTVVLQKIQCEV